MNKNLFKDERFLEIKDKLYPALLEVENILGEETVERIYYLLVDGYLSTNEAEYLQEKRKKNMADYLGMTLDEYERSLKGEKVRGSRKILRDSELLKKILFR